MTDTSMRVNSYRDEARNRTLYQLVAEVGGMHRSVEFDSTGTAADVADALRLLAKQIDDIAVVGVEPPDPWAAARAHWIAQAEGGGCISQDEYVAGRTAVAARMRESGAVAQQQSSYSGADIPASIGSANNQLLTHEEMSLSHQTWLDSQQQTAGPHGLRSGDKAA